MATSAYAWVESDNGPQHETNCYAIGTTAMTSGNVVVLSTTSGTRTVVYPGKEVTGTTTQGSAVYGVVVDTTNYSGIEMSTGRWIKVQIYGYCPIIATETTTAGAIAVGDGLSTSSTVFRAALNGATGGRVTGSIVSFEAKAAATAARGTTSGFILGGL